MRCIIREKTVQPVKCEHVMRTKKFMNATATSHCQQNQTKTINTSVSSGSFCF